MPGHSLRDFQEVFKTLGDPRRGFFERAVLLKHLPTILSSIGSLRGGRYNPERIFEAYYLGDTATTAAFETRMMIKDEHGNAVAAPHGPTVLLTINYDLQRVIDVSPNTR